MTKIEQIFPLRGQMLKKMSDFDTTEEIQSNTISQSNSEPTIPQPHDANLTPEVQIDGQESGFTGNVNSVDPKFWQKHMAGVKARLNEEVKDSLDPTSNPNIPEEGQELVSDQKEPAEVSESKQYAPARYRKHDILEKV